MSGKKRSHHTATNLNFRPPVNETFTEPKGTKPASDPTSFKEIFMLLIIFLCKKTLFFNTNLKVYIYLGSLFLVSLIADVIPIPKIYLSRSDNIFNKFFVKFAWGWNLLLLLPFVILTSLIYSCGNKQKIVKQHVARIGIATFFWYFWTTLFNYIEASFGKCDNPTFTAKGSCLQAGLFWNGFDLSGHSFILIYGSLLIIEETRSIVNWDSIKDYIRIEEHSRARKEKGTSNPLRNLSATEFGYLKTNYEKYTLYIRCLFVALAVMQLLWDLMLISTMFYYHIMIEKLLGGAVAVLTWFVTYRLWYRHPVFLPRLPGDGVFKYIKSPVKTQPTVIRRKESLTDQGPMFMGRPIYAKYQEESLNNVVR